MATIRPRQQATVGSAPWITEERENIQQFVDQEVEDFAFSARNEVDWLNEHMAEIFTSNQFNVTEIFKTPGKLRGKTPRTARKRNPLEARIPLSDVFSTQNQVPPSPSRKSPPKQSSPIRVLQDPKPVEPQPAKPAKQPTDSGYHGLTEDEMDVDVPMESGPAPVEPVSPPADESGATSPSEGRRTTEGSFHSAREAMTATIDMNTEMPQTEDRAEQAESKNQDEVDPASSPFQEHTEIEPTESHTAQNDNLDRMIVDQFDDIGSPSDGSTPDRPLVRKSSLTFAPLPPRDPLNRSIGGRTSHADQTVRARSSYFGQLTNGARLTQPAQDFETDKMELDDDTQALDRVVSDAESQTRTLHNKSSTQRLHDRINMLGKPSRPSKSIPSVMPAAAQVTYPNLATSKPEQSAHPTSNVTLDDDDDWIKPLGSPRPALLKSHTTDVKEDLHGKESVGEFAFSTESSEARDQTPARVSSEHKGITSSIYAHGKSASTTVLPSPSRAAMNPGISHYKTISVSNPALDASYTPAGSPKRFQDGPLSASKLKLQSIMKTAKGLFTSSAGVSAAAKMETLSPSMKMMPNLKNGLYPSLDPAKHRALLESPTQEEGRKTRSSTEKEHKKKEKNNQEQQKMADGLDRAREKERQKAAQFKQDRDKALPNIPVDAAAGPSQSTRSSPRKAPVNRADDAFPVPEQQKSIPRPTSIQQPPQRPNQARRPAKPTRDGIAKAQPVQRVEIKLNHRVPLSNATLAQKLEESLPPQPPPKPTGLMKKASNASMTTTTSSTSFKSSTSTKPKALIAAERKKEQEEREKQRKQEQREEISRKRAAQQEQARREEQKQRAEAEKRERERVAADEAKKVAQRDAIEKRRIDNARKQEELRNARTAIQERPAPTTSRGDLGGPRPPSRLNPAHPANRAANNAAANAARPPKRVFEDEESRSVIRIPGPGATWQGGADSKRRKTEDEDQEQPSRPTMGAPPVRQSNIRKDAPKSSIFSNSNYALAPPAPPISQTAPALLRNTMAPPPHHTTNQPHRVAHPMDKFASGKIPFSDTPNPPQSSNSHFKTPASQRPPIIVKSSPQIANADDHPLPEINTDSESDSDASPSFPVPPWAQKDAVEAALRKQEDLNPDDIFGPIGQIQMDEIFRGADKGRSKRWKDRTSSANWERSGDLLTREEMEKDREGREKLRAEGAWRFDIGRSG